MAGKSQKTRTKPAKIGSTSELAKYLGLSEWTVSRAINGHSEVKLATRQRVLRAMDEIGFQPSPLARGLNGKSTGIVGVCFGNPRNPLMADKIASLDEFLREHRLRAVLAITPRDDVSEGRIIADFRQLRVDGVIMIQSYAGLEQAQQWLQGMKAVHVDHIDLRPSVSVDRNRAMHLIVNHLAALGHRSFASLGFSKGNLWRWLGLQEALRYNGLDPDKCLQAFELENPGRESFAEGMQIAQLVLAAKSRPTALIAVNDHVAAGALRHLTDQGFEAPRDFSITGFDDLEVGRYLKPSLTTIDQRPHAVMRRAVELLIEQINETSDSVTQDSLHIEPRLLARESTGPAPAQA